MAAGVISVIGESAAHIATAAGEKLLELRRSGLLEGDLRAAGDSVSQAFILAELDRLFPGDRVRSEESRADESRTGSRLWIVDPLDGTREFADPFREDWAVHVAVAVDGELVAGAVALPARGLTLSTHTSLPSPGPPGDPPRMLISRTRPTAHADHVAEALGARVTPMGSAGAKAMAVVLGEADVYVHSGGQYEWDSAAPAAVAQAAGLHVSRLDGSPLRYDQPDPWLPDILVCRPFLADAVIAICRSSCGSS